MEKKYILTDETITLEDSGIVLHRIKAIRSFGDVNEGDLGGWVEKEDNLSHEEDCWIYDNARVYGHAKVRHNVCICDNARVYGNATVFGSAKVYDNAEIRDNATVFCSAQVCDNSKVYGNATVYGHAILFDNATVYGHAQVFNNVCVSNNATVYGHANVFDSAQIFDNVEICGDAKLQGNTVIRGNAVIQSDKDYIVFKNWWSSGRYFTWTRSNNMWHVGSFYGTGKELIKKAYKDSEISGREYGRVVKFVKNMLLREKITNFFQKVLCISKKSCTFAKN